jgi:hypothetical protein
MMSTPQSLVPLDKGDTERAHAAVRAGYPAVAPILPELLEWLQDCNWPVAGILSPFLESIGSPLIPHLRLIMSGDDLVWKYWIIGHIMGGSREVAEAFRNELERLAHSPTDEERLNDLHERAAFVLQTHGWN